MLYIDRNFRLAYNSTRSS